MTDDLKERLLPCPFCGEQMENRGHGAIHVVGTGCPIGDLAVDVTKWNTRANPVQEPPSPGVTAGATEEWDTQRAALSIAAMVEEWYDGGWRDHLPFHLIEKCLNRYATPAPVVPAERVTNRRAYQVGYAAGKAAALRSAPPVGARVRPWETRPAGPDAMIPATVEVHRGAWAVVIGTNGKPAGWVDTHDVFANQLYRDHILTTPAALLPAGEGE